MLRQHAAARVSGLEATGRCSGCHLLLRHCPQLARLQATSSGLRKSGSSRWPQADGRVCGAVLELAVAVCSDKPAMQPDALPEYRFRMRLVVVRLAVVRLPLRCRGH